MLKIKNFSSGVVLEVALQVTPGFKPKEEVSIIIFKDKENREEMARFYPKKRKSYSFKEKPPKDIIDVLKGMHDVCISGKHYRVTNFEWLGYEDAHKDFGNLVYFGFKVDCKNATDLFLNLSRIGRWKINHCYTELFCLFNSLTLQNFSRKKSV